MEPKVVERLAQIIAGCMLTYDLDNEGKHFPDYLAERLARALKDLAPIKLRTS